MTEPREIYLDHAAGSPLTPRAAARIAEAAAHPLGNPSSPHGAGRRARAILEEARRVVAAALGAPRSRLVFTGSCTEANRIALFGLAALAGERRVVARTAAEHPGLAAAAAALAARGFEERLIPVDRAGRVDVESFRVLSRGAGVVAIQWANGDLGAVNDVPRFAVAARRRGALLHTDAAQAFGRLDIAFDAVEAETLAVSAAKIGGPAGIGALAVKRRTALPPELPGLSQEAGLRPGTEPVILAAGFAGAVEDLAARALERPRLRRLRDDFLARLAAVVPEAVIVAPPPGDGGPELGAVAAIRLPGVDGALLSMHLDLAGIRVGRGPACRSGAAEPSAALVAAGLAPAAALETLRVSFGPGNVDEDAAALVAALRAYLDRGGGGQA